MQFLKKTSNDWNTRKFISKLYRHQSVKVRLDQGKAMSVNTGREVTEDCCLSLIRFNSYSENLTNEALEGFGNFKTGQVIRTLRYSDYLVLLAKKETVLLGMSDKTK